MRGVLAVFAVLVVASVLPGAASADFPYGTGGPHWHQASGANKAPNDFGDDWKLASTPETGSPYTTNPMELYGVRGAHVVDNADVSQAFRYTTGNPDVTIAVLDSGIEWTT